jgi:hypothetical protein
VNPLPLDRLNFEDPADSVPSFPANRPLTIVLSTVVLIALAGAARLMLWFWPGSFFVGIKSNIWTALAWNFAHGEFYRAPLGPAGYGGTRWMPLLFVTHGLLIRAHADPIHAGVLLMQASVVAAALALFAALRAAGVQDRLAAPLAGTVWATVLYQQSTGELNADFLAAGFAMAGAAAAFSGRRSSRPMRLAIAGSACVLAGLTKVTAVLFVVPIAAWLWSAGRRAEGIRLAIGSAALFASAIATVQLVSAGRFLESFRATMTAGMTASDVWHALPNLGWQLINKPFDVAIPFAVACWFSFRRARRRQQSWVDAYFLAAALVTLAIFATPGTVSNHLVDLQMASTLVIGVALARGELSPRAAIPAYVTLAAIVAAISWPIPGIPSVVATFRKDGPRQRATVLAIHDEFLPPGTRYLSIDPIVPVLNGERPFLVDFFNLQLFLREGTAGGRDLEQRVRRRFFQVVVLRDSSDFPHDMNAGDPGFADACAKYWESQHDALARFFRSDYEVRAVRKPFVILTPAHDES